MRQVIHEGSHIHKQIAEIGFKVRELVDEVIAREQMLDVMKGAGGGSSSTSGPVGMA